MWAIILATLDALWFNKQQVEASITQLNRDLVKHKTRRDESLTVMLERILHYNLKPTNIMLDGEFEPRLVDCGLAHLMPNLGRAASGYIALEYFQNCRYTEKSDIFNFGIILGVLLIGRDPMDPFFGEASNGGSLGHWLHHLQHAGEA
ncbi:hypothetical protein GIB67_040698 [Kingdonia uniflora]|uniref:Protein kinase domain-containing protein n=1 Tax=Kingdonia uniflora TaxID=39325 RepID=A0A7J7KUD7_9MAGN|nr:hypothetical protein GIB67_040698 [Kingdonia uniflora]